jgi:hypothetical protein
MMKPRNLKGHLDLLGCKPSRHQDKKRKAKERSIPDLEVKAYKLRKRSYDTLGEDERDDSGAD